MKVQIKVGPSWFASVTLLLTELAKEWGKDVRRQFSPQLIVHNRRIFLFKNWHLFGKFCAFIQIQLNLLWFFWGGSSTFLLEIVSKRLVISCCFRTAIVSFLFLGTFFIMKLQDFPGFLKLTDSFFFFIHSAVSDLDGWKRKSGQRQLERDFASAAACSCCCHFESHFHNIWAWDGWSPCSQTSGRWCRATTDLIRTDLLPADGSSPYFPGRWDKKKK